MSIKTLDGSGGDALRDLRSWDFVAIGFRAERNYAWPQVTHNDYWIIRRDHNYRYIDHEDFAIPKYDYPIVKRTFPANK